MRPGTKHGGARGTQGGPRRNLPRRLAAVAVLAVSLLVTGCGASASPSLAPGTVRVVTTTTILADLVRQVGGPAVSVDSLVPKGGEVHTFDPTPADVQRIGQARLIFANGLGLDDWLTALVNDAGTTAPLIRLGENLPGVTYFTGGNAGAAANPHLWLNVAYASKYVDRIQAALTDADPADAAAFRASADAYRATLAALDRQIRDRVGALPAANRIVVSFHEAFPYFAAAYGLTVAGTIVAAPGQDPSAGEIADLVARIRSSGAKAIFAEAQFSPKLADTIAGETGVVVVTDLYTDTVGDAPADTYAGMMQSNVDRVVGALAKG
jgi:manganese/iron transport system substrate-binding protein